MKSFVFINFKLKEQMLRRTYISDVGGVGACRGLPLLEMIASCIQSLVQLSQAVLQLAWLT